MFCALIGLVFLDQGKSVGAVARDVDLTETGISASG